MKLRKKEFKNQHIIRKGQPEGDEQRKGEGRVSD